MLFRSKEPAEVVSLIALMRIRLEMKELGLLKLDYTNREIIFSFVPVTKINPTQLIELVQSEKRMRLIPGDRIGYKLTDEEIDHRIDICFNVLKKLKSLMDQNVLSNDENSQKFSEKGFNHKGLIKFRV